MKKIYKVLLFLSGLSILFSSFFISCQGTDEFTRGTVVKQRELLVGGPMAMGKRGDYLLENSEVRVVISKHGISSAFGLFGGNFIDGDRVRAGLSKGSSAGGAGGYDTLVEMLPLFFLAVVDTKSSQLLCDGSGACKGFDGHPAVVKVSGTGASFIALTEKINDMLLFMGGKNRLHFDMYYILQPRKNYVKLKVTLTNKSKSAYVYQTFGGAVPSVAGMVGLFGKRNKIFVPGVAGYNIRFAIEHAFANDKKLKAPAIPGLVGDFVGSKGHGGVSYGIVAELSEKNYIYKNRKEFAKLDGLNEKYINKGSILVPIEGSSITAMFTKTTPTSLKSGESFTYTLYLVIGDGTVGSIRNAQLEIHKKPKGLLVGQVFEEETHIPLANVNVMAYTRNAQGNTPGKRLFYSDFKTDKHGKFKGYLEPGKYHLIARYHRMLSKEFTVEIKKDGSSYVKMEMPREARVIVVVRDEQGRNIPVKVKALGRVGDFERGKCVGKHPLYCLYDPHLGIPPVHTDFANGLTCSDGTPCNSNATCKGKGDQKCFYRLRAETEYEEDIFVSPDGRGELHLRPLPPGKKYKIVAMRGMEYELASAEVALRPGEVKTVELVLKHSVPTPMMISADLHVHTGWSHDSSITDRDRVTAYAAEGVDYFVVTDHNRVRNMQPIVYALKLERWLQTNVGVELTTFDLGHFNAFPLRYDFTKFNGGNPNWFKRKEGKFARYKRDVAFPPGTSPRPLAGLRKGITPKEIFNSLRKLGKISPEQTIVQVNHPRDSIFGYFNAYNLDPDTTKPTQGTGLTAPNSRVYDYDNYDPNFDALEIFNGKRLDLLWHWRIPPKVSPPSGYGGHPDSIIRLNEEGRAVVAYPGGGSDWFNMLNLGKTYTATANSDSHSVDEEAGVPRNYFLTGFDRPERMTDQLLVDVIRKKKVFLTNGPILYFKAADKAAGPFVDMGSVLKVTDHTVHISLKVLAASWVDVSEILIYKNGRKIKTITIPPSQGKPPVERFNRTLSFEVKKDAWFLVVVKGNKGLWPVINSEEIAPMQISQAVGLVQETLLASLSMSFGQSACMLPSQERQITPYAISNPIWIDADKDGKFTPDPCRTLGMRGIRCHKKGSVCKEGSCLDASLTCKSSKDCPTQSQCIDGKCTFDACQGVSCSPTFRKCDAKTPCPNDDCAPDDKRCSDGSPCKKDADCQGKGDGFCRYCACPAARKACTKDGSPCKDDQECMKNNKGKCEVARYCFPTACALGYCEPIYPVCKPEKATRQTYLPLRAAKKTTTTTTRKPFSQFVKTQTEEFSIKNAKKFFIFFEHKH